MAKLPPPPIRDKFDSYTWEDWFRKLRSTLTTDGSLTWSLIDFTGSTLTNIVDRKHNDLTNVQGGTSAEYYHLTSAQHTKLSRINVISLQTPSTGFSLTIGDSVGVFLLEPSGTLASGSITMPASPVNEQVVKITSTQEITALTMNANTGHTLKGGLTTILADGFASWIFKTSTATWYRVG